MTGGKGEFRGAMRDSNERRTSLTNVLPDSVAVNSC